MRRLSQRFCVTRYETELLSKSRRSRSRKEIRFRAVRSSEFLWKWKRNQCFTGFPNKVDTSRHRPPPSGEAHRDSISENILKLLGGVPLELGNKPFITMKIPMNRYEKREKNMTLPAIKHATRYARGVLLLTALSCLTT